MSRLIPFALCALAALVPATAAAECPAVVLLLDHAEQAILEGRLDDYPALADEVDAAFACGPAASPKQVARAFLIQGAHQHFTGSAEGATLSFASARRLHPDGWNPVYGGELKAIYDASLSQVPDGLGQITVAPEPHPALLAVVDGEVSSLPAAVPVGFHLVQITEVGGPALAAQRALVLDPGESVALNLGPLQPRPVEQPVTATATPAGAKKKPLWPLLAAGGAAVLGGGAAWWASAQDAQMETAGSVGDLDAAYGRQQALNATAWTFGGLAAAGVGVWVVW